MKNLTSRVKNIFPEITMTDVELELFSSKIIRREFKKNEIILAQGETETYISFVEKGITRFWTGSPSREITFNFVFENAFLSAYDSFVTQRPCFYNVEALTNTVVWSISHDDIKEYKDNPSFNLIGRLAFEKLFIKKSYREMSLLQDTPMQRYLNLFKEHPNYLQNIPLKYLATYIGITPQALSRIRSRVQL